MSRVHLSYHRFSAVQMRVKSLVKQKLPDMLDMDKETVNKWANKSIGTVHTFQGKKHRKYTL